MVCIILGRPPASSHSPETHSCYEDARCGSNQRGKPKVHSQADRQANIGALTAQTADTHQLSTLRRNPKRNLEAVFLTR